LAWNLARRGVPVDSLNKATIIVNCFAHPSRTQTFFENMGDSLTSGVSLSIEGSQVE
jgi:hypothetical protein